MAFISCNNDFEPYRDLRKGYMMFCALNNYDNTQYVILQNFHFPNTDKKIKETTRVLLSEDGGENYLLKDTVINAHPEYSFYYLSNFTLKRGTLYRVTTVVDSVASQYGELRYCGKPDVSFSWSKDSDNHLNLYLNYNCKYVDYYRHNLFLKYRISGDEKEKTLQIPLRLIAKPLHTYHSIEDYWRLNEDEIEVLYNSFIENKGITTTNSHFSNVFKYVFHRKIGKVTNSENILITGAYVVFSSYQNYLYSYLTENENLEYSLRLGETRYYSNIVNNNSTGYGLIAGVAKDTFSFKIDKSIISEFGFTDAQP